ncbi:MAG: DUF3717 domain-containing protein [Burkholderiales bacterium]|uniref:DUF3717 domain-containing protein n=1 Tax=Inhella sp. TaxID=1921806 RepID=UPI001ACFB513|nr:DUF3717 domain-containing protein [Burkholderiales bacterium]
MNEAGLHITDLESAINHWRARQPSVDGISLGPELRALAEVYGLMVYHHLAEWPASRLSPAAAEALHAWYASTPDSPCIAICSTAQGDALCKGCGRSFEEVRDWPSLSPWAKRAVWRRIQLEASAWRFNRYSERAQEAEARQLDLGDAAAP